MVNEITALTNIFFYNEHCFHNQKEYIPKKGAKFGTNDVQGCRHSR